MSSTVVDVFCENYVLVDWDAHALWIAGHCVTEAVLLIVLELLTEAYWNIYRCRGSLCKNVGWHLCEWLLVFGHLSKEDFLRLFVLDELAHLLGKFLLLHLLTESNADLETLIELDHVHVAEYLLCLSTDYA